MCVAGHILFRSLDSQLQFFLRYLPILRVNLADTVV